MPAGLRKLLVSLHVWVGLSAGLLFLLVAASGLLMIFRTEIERAAAPELHFVQPAGALQSLDELAARARAAYPQSSLEYFRLQGRRDAPVIVRFKDKESLYLDPYTGRVQAQMSHYQGVFGRIEQLHRFFLLAPSIGEPLAGTLAVLALFMLGTGFCIWLPGTWRLVKQTLTPSLTRQGRVQWFAWHKLTGVWVGIIVAFSAFTGVPQGLEWAKGLLYAAEPTLSMAPASADGEALPMQTLWERAAFVVPDAAEALLRFPEKGVAEFYFVERNAPHPNARTYLWLDAHTGAVLYHAAYARAAVGYRLYYWMLSAHLGLIGGPAAQLALLFGSLGFITLVVTGAVSYFRRQSPRPVQAPVRASADAEHTPASIAK